MSLYRKLRIKDTLTGSRHFILIIFQKLQQMWFDIREKFS